jgi:hypothetical protein
VRANHSRQAGKFKFGQRLSGARDPADQKEKRSDEPSGAGGTQCEFQPVSSIQAAESLGNETLHYLSSFFLRGSPPRPAVGREQENRLREGNLIYFPMRPIEILVFPVFSSGSMLTVVIPVALLTISTALPSLSWRVAFGPNLSL